MSAVPRCPAALNARHFVFGMGTNDLGTWPDTEEASRRVIVNLGTMDQSVRDRGKTAIMFNVPNANEAMFPTYIIKDVRAKREYHNVRLMEFCENERIPLADICSLLRDEHFGDELHPNEAGAKIISEEVFTVLAPKHKA